MMDLDAPKYRLALMNEKGETVAFRVLSLGFDGIGRNGTWSNDEEYLLGMKAKEMYRDAAFAAGKWPSVESLKAEVLLERGHP